MTRLETADRLAIAELLARAAWAYDEGRLDVMEACLTEDARMEVHIAGIDPMPAHEGRAAVLALIGGAIEAQDDQRRHVISNVFFESEDTDRAVVVSNLTLLATTPAATTVMSAGLYRDTVVRTGEGWRFCDRQLSLDRPY
jgi:hypothetical protein